MLWRHSTTCTPAARIFHVFSLVVASACQRYVTGAAKSEESMLTLWGNYDTWQQFHGSHYWSQPSPKTCCQVPQRRPYFETVRTYFCNDPLMSLRQRFNSVHFKIKKKELCSTMNALVIADLLTEQARLDVYKYLTTHVRVSRCL